MKGGSGDRRRHGFPGFQLLTKRHRGRFSERCTCDVISLEFPILKKKTQLCSRFAEGFWALADPEGRRGCFVFVSRRRN